METYDISSLEELKIFANTLLPKLDVFAHTHDGAVVLAISGDLGTGKTTFVQCLAQALGVSDVVTSPTFTIMKGYQVNRTSAFENLVHMDAYRIESLDEVRPLRLIEILQTPRTLVCIEWAERIEAALPEHTWRLLFTAAASGTRQVTLIAPQV
jgi:tRNA threonylcarbamoyladenosine biosynthesis protein TsaE